LVLYECRRGDARRSTDTFWDRCCSPAALTLSATGAQADEWYGYTAQPDAVIECGYTTAADCTTAVGKGGMCFVDPDVARYFKRIKPASPVLATEFTQRHG
jgi:hypothetical protein